MRFWDSSAIVPLCCAQPASQQVEPLLTEDGDVVVWWATHVECASAIARLERENVFSQDELRRARAVLDALSSRWSEVLPTPAVRAGTLRLLRRHQLRVADALQLAAAQVWSSNLPDGASLVSLDERLTAAAEREGFEVVPT